MNIQAVNSMSGLRGCQPIKPVKFTGKNESEALLEKEVLAQDTFEADRLTPEEKYDMACLVAGYYKTQYENLLNEGFCLA